MNMPLENISLYTGIDIEEINKLKDSFKKETIKQNS